MKFLNIILTVLAILSTHAAQAATGVDYCPDPLINQDKFESLKELDYFYGLEYISEFPGPTPLSTPPGNIMTQQSSGVLSCLYYDLNGNIVHTYYSENSKEDVGNIGILFNPKIHILKYLFNKADNASTQWTISYEYNYAKCPDGSTVCPIERESIKKMVKKFKCEAQSVQDCPFNVIENTDLAPI